MSRTTFAGLEVVAPGGQLSQDGYAFQSQNPLITDFLLKIGAILHRHDAHAAMADPTAAPVLTVAGTGGTIAAATSIYVAYTLTDSQGGESVPTAAVVLATPAGYGDPTGAPDATVETTAGSMLASTPMYAVSVTDGSGGETALGPPVTVTINPSPSGLAQVLLSGLTSITDTSSGSDPAAGWRLWRSADDGNDWDLMSTGPAATDTWTDDGTSAGNGSVTPLDVGSTGNAGSFTVTVPTAGQPAQATFFTLYACSDSAFTTPCLLGTYPVSDFGATQTFTALAVQAGRPPAVSTCYGGADQINPDTDLLNWPWKQFVATFADLPSTGNGNGDVRETLDTLTIYTWNAATSAWSPSVGEACPAGAAGPAGSNGTDGTDGTNGVRGSLIYMGEGAPGAIAGQLNDDMYIDPGSGNYYWLVAGTWTLEGSLGGGGEITVSDGTTTETDVTTLTFSGATVTSTGAGEVTVTITGGGGGGGSGGTAPSVAQTAMTGTSYVPNPMVLSFASVPAEGDMLVAYVAVAGGSTSAPSGWAEQWVEAGDSTDLYCFTKQATAEESNSYSFSAGNGALLLDIAGATGVDQAQGNVGDATTALTGESANTLMLVAASQNSGVPGWTGLTEIALDSVYHPISVGYKALDSTTVPSETATGVTGGSIPMGVLTLSGTTDSGTVVAARAYRNATLTVPDGTPTKVPLDTLTFDTASNMDVVTDGRFNVPAAGYYTVTANCYGGPEAYVSIYRNGSPVGQVGPSNGPSVTDIVECAEGDYLELWVYLNSGGTVSFGNSTVNYLAVSKVN